MCYTFCMNHKWLKGLQGLIILVGIISIILVIWFGFQLHVWAKLGLI